MNWANGPSTPHGEPKPPVPTTVVFFPAIHGTVSNSRQTKLKMLPDRSLLRCDARHCAV
jgi:hypothetical protein